MKRREFVLATASALAAPAFAARTESGVGAAEIVLGQTAVLTGPLSTGALAGQGGVRIAFEEANAKGGVNARKLRLVSLDDGFDPARAQANFQALLQEHQVFACVQSVGAATTLAGMPLLREHNVPLIAPIAVVDSAREKTEGIAYYTRASQQREAEALVGHFGILGLKRVAVAYLATPGGQEVLGQVQAAAQKHGLEMVGSVAVAPDGKNAIEAGGTLGGMNAQVVVMFLSGPAAAAMMKAVWDKGASPGFYGMSILAGDVTARLLGEQSRGLAVSQVTPYPWDAANVDANQYRKACEKMQVPIGYHSYEGYIAGRVTVEALRQAGRDLSRERVHAVLRKLKMRVGGMDVDFTGARPTGSQFVELVRVRQDGKFVR
jgi:branched-chain amino acid transport system substrate-binding protein